MIGGSKGTLYDRNKMDQENGLSSVSLSTGLTLHSSRIILSLLSGLQLDMKEIEPIFTLCRTWTEEVGMSVKKSESCV